jgi:hypothetical protein
LREKTVEAVVDRNEPEVVRNEEEDDGRKTGRIRGREVAAKPEQSEVKVAATTKGREGGRKMLIWYDKSIITSMH